MVNNNYTYSYIFLEKFTKKKLLFLQYEFIYNYHRTMFL